MAAAKSKTIRTTPNEYYSTESLLAGDIAKNTKAASDGMRGISRFYAGFWDYIWLFDYSVD